MIHIISQVLGKRLWVHRYRRVASLRFHLVTFMKEKGKGVAENPQQTHNSQPRTRYVAGSSGAVEPLDESYRVRNTDYKKFFRAGRVFQTLWTDPLSSTTNDGVQTFQSKVSLVAFDERVHSKVRRFVVVRQGDRCCTCLPVTSYNGRGIKKTGINLREHGFIYSHKRPKEVKGLDKRPLKVELSRGAAQIVDPSLVNYAKPYTVETNVKVKDVGQLDDASRKFLSHTLKKSSSITTRTLQGQFPSGLLGLLKRNSWVWEQESRCYQLIIRVSLLHLAEVRYPWTLLWVEFYNTQITQPAPAPSGYNQSRIYSNPQFGQPAPATGSYNQSSSYSSNPQFDSASSREYFNPRAQVPSILDDQTVSTNRFTQTSGSGGNYLVHGENFGSFPSINAPISSSGGGVGTVLPCKYCKQHCFFVLRACFSHWVPIFGTTIPITPFWLTSV